MGKKNHIGIAGEILGNAAAIDVPQTEIKRSLRELAHEKLWLDYDEESNSLVMSFTGQPVAGIHVAMGRDHHAILDPASHRVVGLYLEHVICPDPQTPRR